MVSLRNRLKNLSNSNECRNVLNHLLKTWGDVDRSSPDADKSPKDESAFCCGVPDAIDDVRRDLSFNGRSGVVAGDDFAVAEAAAAAAAANCC